MIQKSLLIATISTGLFTAAQSEVEVQTTFTKPMLSKRLPSDRATNPLSPLSDPLNGDLKLLTSKANS